MKPLSGASASLVRRWFLISICPAVRTADWAERKKKQFKNCSLLQDRVLIINDTLKTIFVEMLRFMAFGFRSKYKIKINK